MKAKNVLMSDLLTASKYESTPLYETVANYANDNDIDPAELIKMFDENFIYMIKLSASENNHYLKKLEPKLKRRRLI